MSADILLTEELTMDNKQQRKLSRLAFYEDLKVALPIILAGFSGLASLVYVIHIGTPTTVVATCRYQYFVFSPNEWNGGTVVVICKLPDSKFASVTKPAGWTPPEFDAEMEIYIPK